ncbi:MAG: zinc ribbon domain-containing protein [Candidatus Lokiarchaeota archaeon]|nr:zinc ribbon domain-containing protein [Candidatus Lokiarchaeota archaeon]
MSKFCTNCGKPLENNNDSCFNCGTPILKDTIEPINAKKADTTVTKKKSKYILTSGQRTIFLYRILPTVLIGSIIWLISEIIFSTIFIKIEYIIAIYLLEAVLIILLFFASKSEKISLGLFFFFLFSFMAGILSLPIIYYTVFIPQVHMFVTLSLGATLITCFIGFVLRERFFAKGYLWAHIILFVIGTTIVEIIFILIFKIQNFLLTIPVSLAYILTISLTEMFYGAKVVQKNEKDSWIYIFFKIEGILLLSLIIAIVAVVVVLILVAIGIAFGDSDFDFSGLSGGWSTSRKRKQRKRN